MKNTQNNPKTAFSSQTFVTIDLFVKLPKSSYEHFNVDLDGYEGLKEFKWSGKLCRSYPEDDNFEDYFHIGTDIDTIEEAYGAINIFNEQFGVNFDLDLFRLRAKSFIQL